jgi:hypothetical protein
MIMPVLLRPPVFGNARSKRFSGAFFGQPGEIFNGHAPA